jgi:hypothetical protein
MINDPQPSCNNLLADGAQRCNPMPVKTIRVLLSGEEIETLERVRALGFSSNAEILRCATLAWADAASKLPDESPHPGSAADSGDIYPASTSANL